MEEILMDNTPKIGDSFIDPQLMGYEPPIWRKSAFAMDADVIKSNVTQVPYPELLTLIYLKSVWRRVHRTGLSYLASYSGGHRAGKSG